MKFTSQQIDFMRQDIQSGFAITKFIDKTRAIIESKGRDFDKEFEHFQKTKEMIEIKKEINKNGFINSNNRININSFSNLLLLKIYRSKEINSNGK